MYREFMSFKMTTVTTMYGIFDAFSKHQVIISVRWECVFKLMAWFC